MKIGIISDIHGNLGAFKEALELFNAHQVDQILCAGDLIDGGTDGDAVVELIQHLRIPTVMGNHDEDAFVDQAWIRRNMRATGETTHPYLLQSETVGYLTSLPEYLEFKLETLSIYLTHGTPESNKIYLSADSPRNIFQQALRQTNADILIVGHTHQPMQCQFKSRWILNAGSVHHNRFDDSRTCAILTLPQIRFDVFDLDNHKNYPVQIKQIT